MILKNSQLRVGPIDGDCVRACVTSILGIQNSMDLPNIDSPTWMVEWTRFLAQFGLRLSFDRFHPARWILNGYWIASVPSKNIKGASHAIVMYGLHVFHDPSPLKRYRSGRNLLGLGLVQGGFYLDVSSRGTGFTER